MAFYDGLTDAEIEQHYNPRVAVANAEALLDEFAGRSRAARARMKGRLDLAYGPSPLQNLDLFPAERAGAPVSVIIHGGYWRALDKSDVSFLAEPVVEAGATAVVINYDLCPTVTLDEVVRQSRAAVAWTWRHARDFGADPEQIFLAGHSAGAHLAVMALAHDWAAEGLPGDAIKGVAAVSGVYDLAPVLRVSVNAEIRLDAEMARRNSPLSSPPPRAAPILLAVGADETAGWQAQSEEFYGVCARTGTDTTFMRVDGVDHFTIAFAMADAASPLAKAMRTQMGLD